MYISNNCRHALYTQKFQMWTFHVLFVYFLGNANLKRNYRKYGFFMYFPRTSPVLPDANFIRNIFIHGLLTKFSRTSSVTRTSNENILDGFLYSFNVFLLYFSARTLLAKIPDMDFSSTFLVPPRPRDP